MDTRKRLGALGENLAEDFLRKKGFRSIARNHTNTFGELDLVMQDGEEVVFVEVKTRQDLSHGYPEEAVTSEKLLHIARAGEAFLKKQCWEEKRFRIDVVAVQLTGDDPQIDHFEAVDMA